MNYNYKVIQDAIPGDHNRRDYDDEEQKCQEDGDNRGVGRTIHVLDLLVVDHGRPASLYLLRRQCHGLDAAKVLAERGIDTSFTHGNVIL